MSPFAFSSILEPAVLGSVSLWLLASIALLVIVSALRRKPVPSTLADRVVPAGEPEPSSSWLRTLYHSRSLGLARLDREGVIRAVNPGLARLTGRHDGPCEGPAFTDWLHADDREAWSLSPAGRQHELRLLTAEGRACWCRIVLEPLPPDAPETGFLLVVQDIHQRKQLEMDLAERAGELARSNKELEQFALVASHDLEEPLDKIIAFGRLLQHDHRETLGEEGNENLGFILAAAKRMQDLIASLLELARVTVDTRPFEAVDMTRLVREVIADLRMRIEDSGARVALSNLPRVSGDPVQLRQLVQNLVSNALKFHQPDRPPEIEITGTAARPVHDPEQAGRARLLATITVRDRGIGFDPVHADKIFDPFQRLHPKSKFEGTGMGLAICRRIVARHHGYLFAKSVPGEGTELRIALPVPDEAPDQLS